MQVGELDRVLTTAQGKKGQIAQLVNDGESLTAICTALLNEREITVGAPSGNTVASGGDRVDAADATLTALADDATARALAACSLLFW